MKTMLMAGAALAMIAGSASAQDWNAQTYGQDAIGVFNLSANVAEFCRINAGGGQQVAQVGVTPTFTPGGTAGTNAEADGDIALNIQSSLNTVQTSGIGIAYANSQCNTGFRLIANSQNGHLLSNTSTSDPAFIEEVDYDVELRLGSFAPGVLSNIAAGDNVLGTSNEARAGDFYLGVRVNAQNALLLEGTYRDRLVVEIRPL